MEGGGVGVYDGTTCSLMKFVKFIGTNTAELSLGMVRWVVLWEGDGGQVERGGEWLDRFDGTTCGLIRASPPLSSSPAPVLRSRPLAW